MRKYICGLAVLFAATTAHAQDDIVASFQYTKTAPTIDGMGDDAVWADATTQGFDDFFELPGESPDEGDGDMEISFKALWDETNLYFYVEVTDDEIVNDDSNDWKDDSVEFYIDAQNLDVERYVADTLDPDTDEPYPAYQITGIAGCSIDDDELPCNFDIEEDGNSIFTHGTNSYAGDRDLNKYPVGTDTSASLVVDDNTWTYEVAFPWESLFDTPENIQARGEMGFGMAINDDDDLGERDSQWMWQTDNGDLWQRSDVFPSVELVGGPSQVEGDFNGNGERDPADLDLLAEAMQSNDTAFDLNGDGTTNLGDRNMWLQDLANTFYGDSNFDGEFSSADFVTVFGEAKYETGNAATWTQGDWNGDGVFNSTDFVAAFGGGGYEQGPRDGGLKVVPEPAGMGLIMLMLTGFVFRRRNR